MSVELAEQTIVLARVELTGRQETGEFERRDGNWYPKFVACPKAVAAIWLNAGDENDIIEAKSYAEREGYIMLTFPISERNPLDRAREQALRDLVPA